MKAAILAGGSGTRLRPLTFTRPKPMLPLVDKPIIEHIVEYLKNFDIDEIAITTNYLREQIISYFTSKNPEVKLNYPLEEYPLGTAGSVKNIEDYFDDTFVVIQGDNITDIDLKKVINEHKNSGALCTIATYKVEDPWNYGVISLNDDGRIKQFYEKPLVENCKSNLINTGLYIIEPEVLRYIPKNVQFDFARDLFPILLEKECIYGSIVDGFWIDVGESEGYTKAKNWMLSKEESSISGLSDICGHIEGNVIIGENTKISENSVVIGPVVIKNNVVIDKNCRIGPYTCINDNAHIRSNTNVNSSVIFENTTLGEETYINSCFIAENCLIGHNSNIQSSAIIGPHCELGSRVDIAQGSRLWPFVNIPRGYTVSGTIKKFVQTHEIIHNPEWSLRAVTPDEAFYFNMLQGHHVLYTGYRAINLEEYSNILKQVDISSIHYHLRENINDFAQWTKLIICDNKLANEFKIIKDEFMNKNRDCELRNKLISATDSRIKELIEIANKI